MNIEKLLHKAQQAFQSKRYSQACTNLRKINTKPSVRTYPSLELEGLCLIKLKKYEQALHIFKQCQSFTLSSQQQKANSHNLGACYSHLKDYPLAIEALETCYKIDSSHENTEAIILLCQCYRQANQYKKLNTLATKVLSWASCFPVVQFQLVLAAQQQQNRSLIVKHLKAFIFDPSLLHEYYLSYALSTLSSLSEDALLENLISRIQAQYKHTHWFIKHLAKQALKDKTPETAVKLLSQIKIDDCPEWDRKADYYHILGLAFDKLSRFDEAYQAFDAMAKSTKEEFKTWKSNDYIKQYNQLGFKALPQSKPESFQGKHVFMIGFPRSGTTLLDTALDTQKHITTFSEVGSIEAVIKAFSSQLNKRYPQDLYTLTSDEIDRLRQAYWSFIQIHAPELTLNAEAIIVDKMPLNTLHIPLIMTLFPQAKFITSLRHPMAVCLSNFQQNYLMNMEMFHLISFSDCVRRYGQVFDLLNKYIDHYNPNMHWVKYEDLVANFEKEMLAVFNFMQVTHNDKFLAFHEHAQSKVIRTPSRDQVNQPIYNSSTEKWQQYLPYIKEHQSKLSYYIDKYYS